MDKQSVFTTSTGFSFIPSQGKLPYADTSVEELSLNTRYNQDQDSFEAQMRKYRENHQSLQSMSHLDQWGAVVQMVR